MRLELQVIVHRVQESLSSGSIAIEGDRWVRQSIPSWLQSHSLRVEGLNKRENGRELDLDGLLSLLKELDALFTY